MTSPTWAIPMKGCTSQHVEMVDVNYSVCEVLSVRGRISIFWHYSKTVSTTVYFV